MTRNDVSAAVKDSANRFGEGNPQQLKFLTSRLSKVAPEEVAFGLLAIFQESSDDGQEFARQALAGRLLVEILPDVRFDLETVLRAILPHFNLSVAQLPYYLAFIHGVMPVRIALSRILRELADQHSRQAATSMLFWLQNLPDFLSENSGDTS